MMDREAKRPGSVFPPPALQDEHEPRPLHPNEIAAERQALRDPLMPDYVAPETRPESRAARRRFSHDRGAYFRGLRGVSARGRTPA